MKEKEKSCMTCLNTECRVPYKEKLGYEDDGKPMGYSCLGYKNEEKGFTKTLKMEKKC